MAAVQFSESAKEESPHTNDFNSVVPKSKSNVGSQKSFFGTHTSEKRIARVKRSNRATTVSRQERVERLLNNGIFLKSKEARQGDRNEKEFDDSSSSGDEYEYDAHGHKIDRLKQLKLDKEGFKIPESELKILVNLMQDIQKSKRWAKFDAFFGCFIFLQTFLQTVISSSFTVGSGFFIAYDSVFIMIYSIELALRTDMLWKETRPKQTPAPNELQDRETQGPQPSISVSTVQTDKLAKRKWKRLLVFRSFWYIFDVIMLFTLVAFTIASGFSTDFQSGGSGSKNRSVAWIRMLRLVRLARLLKLFRAFRSLGMLSEGLGVAMKTVFWSCVILAFVTYAFASLMRDMTSYVKAFGNKPITALHPDFADTKFQQEVRRELDSWLYLPGGIYNLLALATLSNWSYRIRLMMFGIRFPFNFILTSLLFVFMVVASFGVLKQLTAQMCHCAYEVPTKQRRLLSSERLLDQRQELEKFKKFLHNWGERLLQRSWKDITAAELFQARKRPEAQKSLACLKITDEDVDQLMAGFEMGGKLEISGLTDAISTLVLQRYFEFIGFNMLSPSFHGTMNSLDMVFFCQVIHALNTETRKSVNDTENIVLFSHEICLALENIMSNSSLPITKGHRPLEKSNAAGQGRKDEYDISQAYVKTSYQFQRILHELEIDMILVGLLAPLDGISSAVVITNGIYVSVEPKDMVSTMSVLMTLLCNCLFTAFFILELYLRVSFDLSITLALSSSQRKQQISDLKSMVWMRIFPPPPEGGIKALFLHFVHMLRLPSIVFDVVVIVLSLVDLTILWYLRFSGTITFDPSVILVFRIFRLVKVLKIARLLKVFPKLQLITACLYKTVLQWVWTLGLLLATVYAFAMFMVILFSDEMRALSDGTDAARYFKTLGRVVFSSWQLTTFDNFSKLLRAGATVSPLFAMFILAFLLSLGFGVHHIVMGFMAESAVEVLVFQQDYKSGSRLIRFIRDIDDARDIFLNDLKLKTITKDMLHTLMDGWGDVVAQREGYNDPHCAAVPIQKDSSGRIPGKRPFVAELMTCSEERFNAFEKLRGAFLRAGLDNTSARQVFDQVDFKREACIGSLEFLSGCIEVRDNFLKTNLFSMSRLIKEALMMLSQVRNKMRECHEQMEFILPQIESAVSFRPYTALPPKEIGPDGVVDFNQLRPQAQRALDALVARGEQTENVMGSGNLNIFRGRGKARARLETLELTGEDTAFRTEISAGDLIVIDNAMGHSPNNAFPFCVVVKAVLNNHQIRIAHHKDSSGMAPADAASFAVITTRTVPRIQRGKTAQASHSRAMKLLIRLQHGVSLQAVPCP